MYDFQAKAQEAMRNRKPIKVEPSVLKPLPTVQKRKKFKDIRQYEFRNIGGHVEVYRNGKFQYSADHEQEARQIFYHEDF